VRDQHTAVYVFNIGRSFFTAYGAAIQAGILSGEKCTEGMVVIDINPLTLGIETVDGIMSEIIPRNSEIPITKTKPYTTASDLQESVNIQVFEGERPKTKDNHFLGQFELTGITIAARGVPEIDVIFDIDVNGILTVSVSCKKG
jgi:heat shock protein 5